MSALSILGVSANIVAAPYHRIVPSKLTHGTSLCTFPDGTSSAEGPEMHCYNPEQFLKAYGIDRVHEMGLTGKGQTIIFADSYGSPTLQQDLDHFSDAFKLPKTTIQFIYPNGAYTNPVATEDEVGWAEETTLDLEWAHAVAPDATLVNIVTSSSETTGMAGLQDLFNGIQMAVKQYPHAIVSMSFGTGEGTFAASEVKNYLQGSFHQIFQNAVSADFTLLSSAGDSGSAETNLGATSYQATPDASYPASDPLITAVGGTQLQAGWRWNPEGTADDYWACKLANKTTCPTDFLKSEESTGSITENVWKEDWAIAAGGGGISKVFSTPDFQSNLDSNVVSMVQGHRAIPDVSLNAAINGGVDVYTSFATPSHKAGTPTWQSFGGTSCASPETAGLVALAGQGASEALGHSVGIGELNSILYSLPQHDFRDIVPQTFGTKSQVVIDNDALYFSANVLKALGPTRVPPVAVPGYSTTSGYDLATGLGTPRAESFVFDVVFARVERAILNAL